MTGSMRYDLKMIDGGVYQSWYWQNRKSLPHASPFHDPAWLTAVAHGVGYRPIYVGVFDRDDMVAAVPGQLVRRGPIRVFGSPLRGTMTSYLGPVGVELGSQDLIDISCRAGELVKNRFKVAYARFTLRSAPANGKPDLGPQWRQQRPYSYRLDLTAGEEAVWNGLTSDCRRNIRRALREGIEVQPFSDPAFFYGMLDRTLQRHGSASFHRLRFFEELFGRLGRPYFQPEVAMYEGTPVAAGLFYSNDAELHYLSGASEKENGSLPTSYLLHWRALQQAMENNVAVFNSDASGVRSIDQFKESFRPHRERRHTLMLATPAVYRARKQLISSYRRFRQIRTRVKVPS